MTMKSRRKFLSFLLMSLLVGSLSGPTLAGQSKKKKRRNNQSGVQECAEPGQCRGYGDFLNEAQDRYPDSQFLDGDEIDVGGRLLYRYRMLGRDGRVRDIGVDPNTGEWFDLR